MEDGWEFLFYKKKQYFSAPSTSSGIYYVRYSTDRRYKKVKFCDADSILQGFGEYVGYRAGCYRENSTMMQEYWKAGPVLQDILGNSGLLRGEWQAFCFESCFQIM